MPVCEICGMEMAEVWKCTECGARFCEECGDVESRICYDCLGWGDEEGDCVDEWENTPN